MHLIARLACLVALLGTVAAVQANCKPLLDAIDKLAQQSRFAAYEVDRPEQPPAAEPDTVIIGKVGYVRSGKDWERVDMGAIASDHMNQHWKDLRKEITSNNVACSAAGTGSHRGATIHKFRYDGGTQGSAQLESGTVWIDPRSGLIVYEGTARGGVYLVFGDAVKEPAVRK